MFEKTLEQIEKSLEVQYKKGYEKAVDDFADRMIIMMPGQKQDIKNIAEQLKGGAE